MKKPKKKLRKGWVGWSVVNEESKEVLALYIRKSVMDGKAKFRAIKVIIKEVK